MDSGSEGRELSEVTDSAEGEYLGSDWGLVVLVDLEDLLLSDGTGSGGSDSVMVGRWW